MSLESLAISRHVAQHPVRRIYIGSSREAIDNTIAIMKSIINESCVDYYVRRWAEYIIETTMRDDYARVDEIFSFLREKTKYVKDPDGYEFIKTPVVSLQLIETGGVPIMDCDDYTVLSLSLIKSLGIPVAIRAAAYDESDKFEHVYGLVNIGGYWYSLDVTEPHGIGFEHDRLTDTIDVEV